jgi:hypothetical protein
MIRVREGLAALADEPAVAEWSARRVVEDMVLALQASVLLRDAPGRRGRRILCRTPRRARPRVRRPAAGSPGRPSSSAPWRCRGPTPHRRAVVRRQLSSTHRWLGHPVIVPPLAGLVRVGSAAEANAAMMTDEPPSAVQAVVSRLEDVRPLWS